MGLFNRCLSSTQNHKCSMSLAVICVVAVTVLLSGTANAEFDVAPVSASVFAGETAEFRCQHSTVDFVEWRRDGSTVSRRDSPCNDVCITVIGVLSVLSIVARPEYNGTEVVCVAGDDVSLPAVLHISAAGFSAPPLSLIVASGTLAHFQCKHPHATSYGWRINDSDLLDLGGSCNVSSVGGDRSVLTLRAVQEYNLSAIECTAYLPNDRKEKAPAAILKIQGLISGVKNLTKVGSTISWEPPFSLDLTNVDPDIVYCVDVYNITCGGRDLVSSDCSVTDTNYTSLSDGYLYEYIVTPRSNVEGAENGTAAHLRDALPRFSQSSTQLSRASSDSQINYQIGLNYTPIVQIPSYYTLSLEALDGLSNLDRVETTATEIQPNLLLSVIGLECRRLWSGTILTYECEDSSILNDALLSTHDFRDIGISSPYPDVLRVIGRFTQYSNATGVLVIAMSDTESYYHYVQRDGSSLQYADITGIAGGEYTVSVFVVEQNGLPFKRAAMIPQDLSVDKSTVKPPSPTIEYSLNNSTSSDVHVCINCTFLATDASECMAVVHDRNLTSIESSHKFTRSGDTASGCIEGVNLEDSQVGVVGGKQVEAVKVSEGCGTGCIGGSVIAVLFVIVSAVIVVLIIVFVYKSSLNKKRRDSIDLEHGRASLTKGAVFPTTPEAGESAPLLVNTGKVNTNEKQVYHVGHAQYARGGPHTSTTDIPDEGGHAALCEKNTPVDDLEDHVHGDATDPQAEQPNSDTDSSVARSDSEAPPSELPEGNNVSTASEVNVEQQKDVGSTDALVGSPTKSGKGAYPIPKQKRLTDVLHEHDLYPRERGDKDNLSDSSIHDETSESCDGAIISSTPKKPQPNSALVPPGLSPVPNRSPPSVETAEEETQSAPAAKKTVTFVSTPVSTCKKNLSEAELVVSSTPKQAQIDGGGDSMLLYGSYRHEMVRGHQRSKSMTFVTNQPRTTYQCEMGVGTKRGHQRSKSVTFIAPPREPSKPSEEDDGCEKADDVPLVTVSQKVTAVKDEERSDSACIMDMSDGDTSAMTEGSSAASDAICDKDENANKTEPIHEVVVPNVGKPYTDSEGAELPRKDISPEDTFTFDSDGKERMCALKGPPSFPIPSPDTILHPHKERPDAAKDDVP